MLDRLFELTRGLFGNAYYDELAVIVILILVISLVIRLGVYLLELLFIKLSNYSYKRVFEGLTHALSSINWLFYVAIAAIIVLDSALQFVTVFQRELEIFSSLILAFIVVVTIQSFLGYILREALEKRNASDKDKLDPTTVQLVIIASNALLWLVAITIVLQNQNINVTALVGGLGVTGIAVAFALQNIFADIFASFSIYFDKPFRVGDTIQIGEDMGEVKNIGLKTTRLKTVQGEELVVSNKELSNTRIRNYRVMSKRRVVFEFCVDPDTPTDLLKEIPNQIKHLCEDTKNVNFIRCTFKKFGVGALVYEVAYYILSNDYTTYMTKQQSLNLGVMNVLTQLKVKQVFI